MAAPGHEETGLAVRLRSRREAEALTQDELARQADVKIDTLRAIEQGRTLNPGILTVLRLAEVLAVSLDELVGYEPRPTAARQDQVRPSGGAE